MPTFTKHLFSFIASLLFSNFVFSQSWKPKADFINGESSSAYAFTINDTIYVGNTGNVYFFKYDPVNDKWTKKGNVPAALNSRTGSTGFSINGKGYLLGGVDFTGTCNNDLWEYTPATDSWVQKKSLPGGKRAWASCFVIGSNVYLAGGIDTLDLSGLSLSFDNSLWKYDQLTDTWSKKAALPYDSSYIYGAFAFSINNKGYISCGLRLKSNGTTYNSDTDLTRTYQYDTTSDSWTQKANFPSAGRSEGVSFVLSGKAYCGTGLSGISTVTSYEDFYAYDPVTNTWSAVISPGFGTRADAIAASLSNGTAYVGTGWEAPSTTVYYADWWQFNPLPSKVNDPAINSSFACYPNPCNSTLYIDMPAKTATYSITNILGKTVLQGTAINKEAIGVSHLSNGIYVISMHTTNTTQNIPFEIKR